MASRKISDLHKDFQPRATALLAAWKAIGLDVLVTSTLRTLDEQALLYAQGRTLPGKIITKAKPGYSFYNFGLALDAVPLVGGKPAWNTTSFASQWTAFGQVVRECGLSWGGDWRTFKDYPHVEFHPGLTLAEARALGPALVAQHRLA